MPLRIAIDAMGGDIGPPATFPATLSLAKKYPDIVFLLYGEEGVCRSFLPQHVPPNVHFITSANSVLMTDLPGTALRQKRDSSMGMALSAVANSEADGCISAGNTGALVAMSTHFLACYPKIHRPVLCQALPTHHRPTYLLDLGANVDCSADQLVQFAYLGAAFASVLQDIPSPVVKMLNIGSEGHKGTSPIKQAADQLSCAKQLNYQGFIEGDELYQGNVDVIVCDGFAGNIALKTSEGVARFVTDQLKALFSRTCYGHWVAWMARPVLRQWLRKMNPGNYNGAYFIGLRGAVVKSHGSADQDQFARALTMLIHQLQQQKLVPLEEKLLEFSRSAD